jgi:Sulfotransferase family
VRTKLKRIYKLINRKYAALIFKKNKPYLNGYDRIYHVHIRKSAGTSINSAFWDLGGLNLKGVKRKSLLIKGKFIFVRNNEHLIEEGNYFYANSHIPYWNIKLPKDTFKFCMLRDPYKRLLSLYRYLNWIKELNPKNALREEPYYNSVFKQTQWLGDSFNEFLDNLPINHLQNQLYIFSKNGDIVEALSNIEKLDAIYNQEDFDNAIKDLSLVIGQNLSIKRERTFSRKFEFFPSKEEEKKARKMLLEEYKFYNSVTSKFAVL